VQRQSSQAAAAAKVEASDTAVSPAAAAVVTKKSAEPVTQPDATAVAQLKRQVNQPAIAPKSQIDAAEAPAIAQRTDPAELTPQNTSSLQKATTSVTRVQPERDVTPEATTQTESLTKRELDLAPQPTVAQAAAPAAAKQARLTERPSAAVAQPQTPGPRTEASEPSLAGPSALAISRSEAQAVAEKTAAAEAALPNNSNPSQVAARNTRTSAEPSPATPEASAASAAVAARSSSSRSANVVTKAAAVEANSAPVQAPALVASASSATVSRQSAPNSASASRTQPSLDAPNPGAGTNALSGGLTRANSAAESALKPNAPASNAPQRATRVAAAAVSPRNVESPSAQPGEAKAEPGTAEPARLALNRSQSGMAGSGNTPNLDRGVGAPESPALLASSAARRDTASRADAPDAALTPASLATRAQSRASAVTPSSHTKADVIATGSEGGANEVSDLVASSGASLQRASANAAPGDVSAAKGSGDIDTGNTMIVAETGAGRAAGGGQPELSFDPAQGTLARQRSGAAPDASLAVEKVASTPAAPAATGGGTATSLDPTQSLAVRGQSADGAAGGPSRASDNGPLAEPSTAALLADSAVSRADHAGDDAANIGTEEEDEEEKKKRLARARRAQLAAGSATVAEIPVLVPGAGSGTGSLETGTAAAANTATTRVAAAGGASAAGALPNVGDANPQASGTGAAVAMLVRADVGASAPAPETLSGGGTGRTTRAATGQTIAASTQAEMVAMAGAPASGGNVEGINLQAQGTTQGRTSGGAAGPIMAGPIGAKAGEQVVDAIAVADVGQVPRGTRQASPGAAEGPVVVASATGTAPGRSTRASGVVADSNIEVAVAAGNAEAQAQADLDHGLDSSKVTRFRTAGGGGLTVNLEAPEGTGGIGNTLARDVGLSSRLARSDSPDINASPSRFVGRRSGGLTAVSLAAVIPTDSYRKRAEGRRQGGSLPPQTETAIENGLAFLARFQQPDGSWRLQGMEANVADDPILVSDTAATAMAILAFQGAGYSHREHNYAAVVRNGLDYLVRNQRENGDLFVPLDDSSNKSVWLYSHALATLAVCEAYGMTQDPALKEPATKAVQFILAGQSKDRGGWRYAPGVGTDTSVTGAMLVALRSAQLSNIAVDPASYEKVRQWLDKAQGSPTESHLYRYNPYAPDTEAQRHGRVPGPTMTSLGLLMRLYLGWKRDNPAMTRGAEYLVENLPDVGSPTEMKRDTYYWYYATQVMYHMGGEHWKKWHEKLHTLLTTSQVKDGPYAGSWNARLPVPDRWAAHGGRLYVTALNLLSLEVQYRHLPTYEDTAK
jgi:hypothetical protein